MPNWRVGRVPWVPLAVLLTVSGPQVPAAATPDRVTPPNIVLILADDLGFSDIAPYGSEINTPALSAMAEQGVRFSSFHVAASCAPTRAMLLTGVDSHRNGVPNIPEAIPPEQRRAANYQGTLSRNVVTVATRLRDAGYHTYMVGKWHLGHTPDLLPSRRGFERTVAMADTGADHWEQKPYLPIYEKANWYADGEETDLPEDYYSSRFLVDKMIEFIDSQAGDGQPFFAYLPFLAVHTPVQAPQTYIDRQMGNYDTGWDALREQRRARAVALGLLPDTPMVRMATTGDWGALTAAQRRYQAKRMAVYAAMIEAMDYHIGRLIEHLRVMGHEDNTVFMFASDNGSEATGMADPDTVVSRCVMRLNGYHTDYGTLGLRGSFNTIGPSFASAAAAPLAFYKFYAGEGGMRVPLIIAGAPLSVAQPISHAFTYVTDIAPTLMDLAGVAPTGTYYGGRPVEPMSGRSLMPLVQGQTSTVYGADDGVGYELGGNAAYFLGDYKIALNRAPAGDGRWHLYDIVRDPGEAEDLAERMPARLQRMQALYADYVAANGVLAVPDGYVQQSQVALNGLRDRYGQRILIALLTLLVVLPFYLFRRRTA